MSQYKGIEQHRWDFVKSLFVQGGVQSRRFQRRVISTSTKRDWRTTGVPAKFWNKIQEEYLAKIRFHSRIIYRESAIAHGMDPELAASKALKYAQDRSAKSSEWITQTTIKKGIALDKRLKSIVESPQKLTRQELLVEIRKVFDTTRGKYIAINESTEAASQGALDAVEFLGLSHAWDRWKTNPSLTMSGPCPVCLPLNKKTRKVWSRVAPLGPPVHIGCVCEIVFYHSTKIRAAARKNKRRK